MNYYELSFSRIVTGCQKLRRKFY